MSEFECRNRHLMSASDRTCKICGESVHYMDGMTGKQLAMQDAASRDEPKLTEPELEEDEEQYD